GQPPVLDGQGKQVLDDEVQLVRVGYIQLDVVVREDRVDGRQVCPRGGGEDARLIQAAGRAEVDALSGGEDALVRGRDGQESAAGAVADPAVGDDGPRRGDAAADGDVAQDAKAGGGQAELARAALGGDPAAQAAGDADVAEDVAQRDHLP